MLVESVHITIPQIWNELPVAFGDEWMQIEDKLWELLRRLESGDSEAAGLVVALFRKNSRAYSCLEEAAAKITIPQEKRGITAGTVSLERFISVPVLYGTDRVRDDHGYSGNPNNGLLTLGVAQVSIPENHRRGELERPPWWKLGFGWDSKKHVKVLSLDELAHAEFIARARAMFAQGGQHEALVFIHGFNASFDTAARRTAQLSYDLKFQGISMLYSWPSKGKLSEYVADEDKILWTRPRLKAFLSLVATKLGVEGVHVIAHSMGNRALVDVLKDLAHEMPDGAAPLRQVVFAAPDINAQTFEDLAEKFHNLPQRCTLYACANDKALQFSKKIHNSVRAGDSGAYLTIVDGVDTIDVTAVDTSFLGHSPYGENNSVITDLDLLIQGLPAEKRPQLNSMGAAAKRYWVFRP